MFLPLLPLEGNHSMHSERELPDRPSMFNSTLAEDMELLHGNVPSAPQSRQDGCSKLHTSTTSCHQHCESKYYHSITPKATIHSKPKKLKDGCLFSFFKPSPRILTSTPEPPMTASPISKTSSEAATLVSTAPSEDNKSQDERDEAFDHFTALGVSNTRPAVPDHWKHSDPQETDKTIREPSDGEEETKLADKCEEAVESKIREHVTPAESFMNGSLVDHEESLSEALAARTPAGLPFDSGSGPDGVPDAQLGTKLPTADHCSDDDLRISDILAQNIFISIVEGDNLNHVFPFLTQQAGSLDSADNSAKEAPQTHRVIDTEPTIAQGNHQEQAYPLEDRTLSLDHDTMEPQARQGGVGGSALNHNLLEDAPPPFKSKNTRTKDSAAKVVEDPAQGPSIDATQVPTPSTAGLPLLSNLERPDMSWASDSPVAFTASYPKSSVNKKLDQLRDRAEAAFLRRQILKHHAAQRGKPVDAEEAEITPAPPAQEKEDKQVVSKSGKISNRKKQRQSAKAKRQALAESSVTAAVTPDPAGPSSAVVITAPMGPLHTNGKNHHLLDDEFKVEARLSKRSQRAKAFAESQEKKAHQLKAAQELKVFQEKEIAAQLTAVPVLTASAKRRNRQKRNKGSKSCTDA